MPHVINGIGTWYHGKQRIHTQRDHCEFCNRFSELTSYDTTLFFVVFFIPLIPLQKKRILRQCVACQRHRMLPLKEWETAKARDGAELLQKMRLNPDDRDTVLQTLVFSQVFQDEPLFNVVVANLPEQHFGDAAIQAQIGYGNAYFSHWVRAEEAFRASLAIEDNEEIREQLAMTLLKQGRPDDARPYLQHILDTRKTANVGFTFYLVEGYQAQGRHEEALALIDERDQAFPDLCLGKEGKLYRQQRKTSERYRHRGKKIPTVLGTGASTGYREGNWTSRIPRLVPLILIVVLAIAYFATAIYRGQSRRVFLVNGTKSEYAVFIQNQEYRLPANGVVPIDVGEGEIPVKFADGKLNAEPISCQIETPFWSRPFNGHTFVINPDQSAVISEEEAFYAQANPKPSGPAKIHAGKLFYDLPSVDYEFKPFPGTIKVKGRDQVRKTRIAWQPELAPDLRLNFLTSLVPKEQVNYCRQLLRFDPNNLVILNWLNSQLTTKEMIAFLETRLDDRPILVEWHRLFQSLMERDQPEVDLLPRYRALLEQNPENPDALYLLGRADPNRDQAVTLLTQAAAATPSSGYALLSLGNAALSEARFADAKDWLAKSLARLGDHEQANQKLNEALLANKDYDQLLQMSQRDINAGRNKLVAQLQMMRVHAIRGDMAKAQALLALISRELKNNVLGNLFQSMLFCCQNDVPGYLKALGDDSSFEAAFLKGEYQEAAKRANAIENDAVTYHGLLYLAAVQSADKAMADDQLNEMRAELQKGGRDEKAFAKLLADGKPRPAKQAQQLIIEPNEKRVLLAVLASRDPAAGKELLELARKLNYQHDAISLCLTPFLTDRKK